jgi:hypothetical protein
MREGAWEAPIIVVGAGRSGSTRIMRALGAHRDVYMIGETSFLLPRLWAALHEREDYSRQVRLAHLVAQTHPEARGLSWWQVLRSGIKVDVDGQAAKEVEAAEALRMQRAFGAFVAELMIPPPLRRPRWGFKEIWAGTPAFPYDWTLYRAAYPEAHYVQSIRHPLEFLSSYISNMRVPVPDEDGLMRALRDWVAMVCHARSLRDTGRYVEFRMEDFDEAWPRILDALALPPDPTCLEAAAHRYVPSERRDVPVRPAVIDRVDGLRALAEELRYELPRSQADLKAGLPRG